MWLRRGLFKTMPEIIDKSPEEIQSWIETNEAYLVDVREEQEIVQGKIPNTDLHIPLSRFDPEEIPRDSNKKLVFICAQGVRSFQVGQYLLDQKLILEAYNLQDGITGWRNAGLPIEFR